VKIGLVSLGCPRNLVDSEFIVGSLRAKGHRIVDLDDAVDVAIVNTCSFIESAKEESVDVILKAADLKAKGKVRYLIVAGCLAQRYHHELANELKEVDAFVGTSDYPKIPSIVEGLRKGRKESAVTDRLTYLPDESVRRSLLTPGHYAYLKISEGCSNRCSYCVISSLRGRFRSRTLSAILREARSLAAEAGTKELCIIGQDTTAYGIDLYGKAKLAGLLRRLSAQRGGVRWIRLLYTHPAHFGDSLIDAIANEEKVCKYVDLPVQHSSDAILRRMNRKAGADQVRRLIEKLRRRVEGLAIRTSVIVGFPGETERDFEGLLTFMRDVKFERLGAFAYSREEGTRAYAFDEQIEEKVKRERLERVMRLQQSISEEVNRAFLGKTLDVLIDEEGEEAGVFLGRTQADAPEVDGIVYVKGGALKPGDLRRVRIVDTLEYDLVGIPI